MDGFYRFPAAIFLPFLGTKIWRFHTELYKFVGNFVTDNLSTECLTDLRPGEVDYLLIFYDIVDFLTSFIEWFRFYLSVPSQYMKTN